MLVFSDLDGTLLNHDDYSFEAAIPAINILKQKQIPLILCTSKTRPEVEALRKQLDIHDPFITENGAGIFFPDAYKNFTLYGEHQGDYMVLGHYKKHEAVRNFLIENRNRDEFIGFGDMNVTDVMNHTNLPQFAAALAMEREFTEPFIVHNHHALDRLIEKSFSEGFRITRGGRFHHLSDQNATKGNALKLIKAAYEENLGKTCKTIALGDSPNDFEMLREADYPVLVPHPDGNYENVDIPNLKKAPYPGSLGWNVSIQEVLSGL